MTTLQPSVNIEHAQARARSERFRLAAIAEAEERAAAEEAEELKRERIAAEEARHEANRPVIADLRQRLRELHSEWAAIESKYLAAAAPLDTAIRAALGEIERLS